MITTKQALNAKESGLKLTPAYLRMRAVPTVFPSPNTFPPSQMKVCSVNNFTQFRIRKSRYSGGPSEYPKNSFWGSSRGVGGLGGVLVERRLRPRTSHNPHQDPRRRVYIKKSALLSLTEFGSGGTIGAFSPRCCSAEAYSPPHGPRRVRCSLWPWNVYKNSQFSYME